MAPFDGIDKNRPETGDRKPETADRKPQIDVETLSELVEGGEIFECTGYSDVRVTKDGVVKKLRLKIRTRGVTELMKSLSAAAPRPPVIKEETKEDDKTPANMIFNFTDEEYIKKLSAHGEEVIWRVLIQGLDIAWRRKDGSEITEFEKKKQILIGNGITVDQANRLCGDIRDLARWQEDRKDFLSGSLLA